MAGLALSLVGWTLLWRFDPGALTTGTAGLDPVPALGLLFGAWTGYLLLARLTFHIYSRFDVSGVRSPRCAGLPGEAGRRTGQAAALSPGMVG